MNNSRRQILLLILGILGLIVITVSVTYAFFSYTKEGTTDNTITTGTISFLYTETSGIGNGISISNAYPISDNQGKTQIGSGNIFDFKVTSNTPNNSAIPYTITARKKVEDNMLDENAVKLYLTKVSGDTEEELLLDNYSNLTQIANIDSSKYVEKIIYEGKVPSNSKNYEQSFRLRMWINDSIDLSPVETEEGNDTYPYNGKTFTVTVNVYANAKVVTEEDIELESSANISSLSVDGIVLTPVTNQDYDYEITLDNETISTTIEVETESPYATVNVEKIDSLAYEVSSVKRLSANKEVQLIGGDNFFKVTVTSENKKIVNEFKIKIYRKTDEYTFDYTGQPETFIALKTGYYKIEVWGASGNIVTASNVTSSYGGYATGKVTLTEGDELFIYVGGQGKSGIKTSIAGGYNGGGAGKDYSDGRGAGSGGGATHIASSSGLLSELETNKEAIIIVAGGGGGVGNYTGLYSSHKMIAGSGGGIHWCYWLWILF